MNIRILFEKTPLVPRVAGGNTTFSIFNRLTLNGGYSYDPDFYGSRYNDKDLKFIWECDHCLDE